MKEITHCEDNIHTFIEPGGDCTNCGKSSSTFIKGLEEERKPMIEKLYKPELLDGFKVPSYIPKIIAKQNEIIEVINYWQSTGFAPIRKENQ